MSLISSGIVNSNEGRFHLMVKTDESKTSLLLYIAPPPSRPDTQQIPEPAPKDYTAVVTTCLTLRFLGTAERIFHVRAVIDYHNGGKDKPPMC